MKEIRALAPPHFAPKTEKYTLVLRSDSTSIAVRLERNVSYAVIVESVIKYKYVCTE